jgi:hypothetical protein
MSESLRTDPPHAVEPASDAEREAKIEQLLLAGLDHYFSARYEHAINVWTRALFLDRSHARARAYIERARSALAERQRESEELLHNGVAAFDRGEGPEARRLLQAAMNQGAPSDEALAILDRLNRLEQGALPEPQSGPVRARPRTLPLVAPTTGPSRVAWAVLAILLLVIVTAGAFGAGAFRSDWRTLMDRPSAPSMNQVRDVTDEGLALPRRGETALVRARALVSSGRLRDALATLDLVRPTDAQRPDADRLRADIQKQLIGLSAVTPAELPADKGGAHEP